MDPVSVVLLAHNEAEVIEGVIRDFDDKILQKIPGSEIVVAEDGSTDGTKEILARLVNEIPGLRWEEGKERRGYVQAFKKAMTLPQHDWIVFCDSSGKHDPDDFWKMYELRHDFDMIIGYKVKRKDPLYRVALTKGFNFLVNRYFRVAFKDIDCPLRLFSRQAFSKIAAERWLEESLINFELTLRFYYKGYRVTQVPVQHFARQHGPSRGLPFGKIPKVVVNVLKVFPKLKHEITQPSYGSAL